MKGTEELPAVTLKVQGERNKLMALQALQKPRVQTPLNLPAEISQGKLLEVALHNQKKNPKNLPEGIFQGHRRGKQCKSCPREPKTSWEL